MPPLLTMRDISKRFGPTQALRGVSLDVPAGEVVALLGENGAGKSTLMKILSGALLPDSGTIEIAGQPFVPGNPHQARLAGIAMIYQELNLAPDLSVEDNMLLGQEQHRWGWVRHAAQRARVREVLATLGHPRLDPSTLVAKLSVAERQVVEIGRALVSQARVIVFDEPTSSLTRADTQRLFDVIRKLRMSGLAIVYISHFLEEITEICQSYSVLRDGETVASGSLTGVTEKQLVALMVGRDIDDLFPHVPHSPGETILKITGLCGQEAPRDVSLEVRGGEILGIAGLVGAGRTEFLRCVYGLDRVARGEVNVAGKRLTPTPRRSIAAGLGIVSEDRKGEGLAQTRSLADNLTYSRLAPYSRWGWISNQQQRQAARHWLSRLQVKAHSVDQAAATLSGGNQQKVAIARVLHQEADVLLFDEPTRGIDVGTKAEIYRLIGEQAAAGKSILFVSSSLPELLKTCDRIAVFSRGQLVDVRPTEAWSAEELLEHAIFGERTSTGAT